MMTPQSCPTMSALHCSSVVLLPRHATQVIDDFVVIHGDKWRATTADCAEATGLLEPALTKYQVPDTGSCGGHTCAVAMILMC